MVPVENQENQEKQIQAKSKHSIKSASIEAIKTICYTLQLVDILNWEYLQRQ